MDIGDLVYIVKAPKYMPTLYTPIESVTKLIGTIGEIINTVNVAILVQTQVTVRCYVGLGKSQWVDENHFWFYLDEIESFLK